MSPYIGQYIEYSQIYDEPLPSVERIKEFLHQYNSRQLLQLLCKVNIAIWKAHGIKDSLDLQKHLIKLLIPSSEHTALFAKLKKIINPGTITLMFHRHQMLLAIKMVLMNPNEEGIGVTDATQIGKYLLALSEYLQGKEPALAGRFDSIQFEYTRKSISRLGYFTHYGIFINNIGRAFISWGELLDGEEGKIAKSRLNFDLDQEFTKATGLTIKEYLSLGFVHLGKLFELDYKTNNPHDFMLPRNYLSLTSLSADKQESIYKAVSQNPGEYRENRELHYLGDYNHPDVFINDFLYLIEHPVININDTLAVVADPEFFEDRVVSGPYWILHNKFIAEEGRRSKKAQQLSAFYGDIHQIYTKKVLSELCDEVITVRERGDNNTKTCDYIGVINDSDGRYLVAVEAKKIAPSLNLLLFSDEDTTVGELNKIFGDKGFGQVFSTVSLIQASSLDEISHINHDKIKAIFPVVVTDRFIVEEPLNRNLYEKKFFNPMIEKYNPGGSIPVSYPMFFSTEELELMEAGQKAKVGLSFLMFLSYRSQCLGKRIYRYQKQFLAGIRLADIGEIVNNLDIVWNDLYSIGFSKHPNKRLQKVVKSRLRKLTKILFPVETSAKNN